MKRINELFNIDSDIKILSLHSDSRYVGKDSIFFCIEGRTTDGHRYADDAVFQGAKCIVHSKPLRRYYPGVIYHKVDDVLGELNRVADVFYDHPSKKLTTIGITGSSGKTVIALTIKDILSHLLKMGYIGTNDARYGDQVIHSSYTTPESIFMHRTLADMVKSNVKGATIEVSSLGLALKRVDTVHFDIAICTNVYEEHMDIHGTMENLMSACAKLINLVDEKGTVVLNADSARFMHYVNTNCKIKAKKLTYGIEHTADIQARNISLKVDRSEFDLYIRGKHAHISVPLIGKFNISNLLAAVGGLLSLEMPFDQIIEYLPYINQVDGRMEHLDIDLPFHVIVDYCSDVHNYKAVFHFARKVKKDGRIIAVFGVSPKKNRSARKQIGLLANEYCDQVILTEENNDDSLELCEEVQSYLKKPVSVIISNRRIAIMQAIELACEDDIILILGKGHEQFMRSPIGNTPYPGDKYIALQAVQNIFHQDDEWL